MKFIISLGLLFSVVSCSNLKQEKKIDDIKIFSVSEKAVPSYQKNYKTVNVYGNVKEIICTNYVQFVPNSDINNNVAKMNYKFDRKGNIIEETSILKDDVINYRYVYSYDKMNNALILKGFDESGNLKYVMKDSLNRQGFLVFQDYQEFAAPQLSYKSYHKYEKISDTLVIYNTHSEPDKYKAKQIERYKNGNLLSKDYYSDGIHRKNEYKYDKNSNKIFDSEITSDTIIWARKFDKNNREIKWSVQKNNKIENEIEKSYDEPGNIIKEVFYEKGKLNDNKSFYDILVYDSQNNWIKRSRFRLNGDKVSVLERKITYY